jgi:hypothetical protein
MSLTGINVIDGHIAATSRTMTPRDLSALVLEPDKGPLGSSEATTTLEEKNKLHCYIDQG